MSKKRVTHHFGRVENDGKWIYIIRSDGIMRGYKARDASRRRFIRVLLHMAIEGFNCTNKELF